MLNVSRNRNYLLSIKTDKRLNWKIQHDDNENNGNSRADWGFVKVIALEGKLNILSEDVKVKEWFAESVFIFSYLSHFTLISFK